VGESIHHGKNLSHCGKKSTTLFIFSIIDDLANSLKRRITVIPANPGSGPGQAPESSYFKYLKILWTPVSTGVTTFYEIIIIEQTNSSEISPTPSFPNPAKHGTPFCKGREGGIWSAVSTQLWTD